MNDNETSCHVLECVDIPKVAMDMMNDVHCEELTLVNKVNKLIETSKQAGIISTEINPLMEEWFEHTKAHFSRENTLMETYSFPAFHCHHSEHEQALDQLETIFLNWRERQDLNELAQYVQNIWPQWFVNHISTMDVVTSAFIKQSMNTTE